MMSKIRFEKMSCPVCGSNDATDWGRAVDRLGIVAEPMRLVKCATCELVHLNPRPVVNDISHAYPSDYDQYAAYRLKPRSEKPSRLLRAALGRYRGYPFGKSLFDTLLFPLVCLRYRLMLCDRHMLRTIPWTGSGRLLDVGCGNGKFLLKMRVLGWQVHGVEMNPRVAETLRSVHGVDVRTGALSEQDFPDGAFDTITFWHVVEHLYDPVAELLSARRALAEGGLIYLGVPVLDSWAAERFGTDWFHLDAPRHVSFFTRKTIRALLERAGFAFRSLIEDFSASGIEASAKIALTRNGPIPDWCRSKKKCRRKSLELARQGRADAVIVIAEKK